MTLKTAKKVKLLPIDRLKDRMTDQHVDSYSGVHATLKNSEDIFLCLSWKMFFYSVEKIGNRAERFHTFQRFMEKTLESAD